MRKRLINPLRPDTAPAPDWLDLEGLAQVEVTSEDEAYPIEGALLPAQGRGWRAAHPGAQTIRLLFDLPLRLSRIHLLFKETDQERTQEFVLRWSPDGGRSFQEIVRQQWNFSPQGATSEAEEYRADLSGVTALELMIIPDLNGGATARASLEQWRLAGLPSSA